MSRRTSVVVILTVASVCLLPLSAWSQTLAHAWSQHFGDGNTQYGYSVAVDSAGNVLLTGSFAGTVDFGGATLVSAGSNDVFVAKFDAAGNHLWSQGFGDASAQYVKSVGANITGNVVVAGYFQGSVDFGGGALASAGGDDIFVAKFDAAGNHLWSQRFGDMDGQRGLDLALDSAGNVLVTGSLYGTVDFGGGVLTSTGDRDIFLAKFDGSGGHLWSQRFGDADLQLPYGVAVDDADNVVVGGAFRGAVDFGGGVLTSAGDTDVFLAKFDSAGNPLWSQRFGDTLLDYVSGVTVDGAGNVVVVGFFDGTIDFGGGVLTSAGSTDVCVARLDASGNHLWSQRFGDANIEYGNRVAVDGVGGVLVTGYFLDTIDFGGGVLTSAGSYDIFMAKLLPTEFAILSVNDVPGDQGGWARVHFEQSLFDSPAVTQPVFNYHVFRRVDNPALAAAVAHEGQALAPGGDLPGTLGGAPVISLEDRSFWRAAASGPLWEAVATVPARQEAEYIGLVPTLADSGSVITYSVYFVMAQTINPLVFYDSAPDSGYSVDNLSPAVPAGLAGTQVMSPTAGLELAWDANGEHDLSHYAVYRGTTSDFVPGPGNRLGTSAVPMLLDDEWTWDSGYYYKVSALDIHGNESGHAALGPENVVGVGNEPPPLRTFLAQNHPNPFNPTTRIVFGLKEAGEVSLRVYDASGRRVRVLTEGRHEALRYELEWDGRDDAGRAVASGVYFYRLVAGGETLTRKAVLLK